MRKFLLLTAVSVFCAAPVVAQESVITIIHDDGSKDVVDLSKKAIDEPPAREEAPSPQPRETQASAPVAPADVSSQTPVEDVAEPAPKPVEAEVVKPAKPVVQAALPRVPLPPRKPLQRELIDSEALSRGISKKQAIMIALDYAPPSSDVDVRAARYADAPALAVVFKVEEGLHEVLLDPVSGRVLDSRAIAGKAAPRPGYLQ